MPVLSQKVAKKGKNTSDGLSISRNSNPILGLVKRIEGRYIFGTFCVMGMAGY